MDDRTNAEIVTELAQEPPTVVGGGLWDAADVIDHAFKKVMPDSARETINKMAYLALRYPAVWAVFKAFIDANLNGELKRVPPQ